MGIELNISSNIESIPEYLDDIKHKVVVQAARTAINKTLKTAKTLAVKRIKMTYKLKPSGLSVAEVKKLIREIKSKGGSIRSLDGALIFSGSPISLMKFVSGNKQTIKQKGIKIKKRRKLKAEITPGKKIILKKAFIQKVNSTQVFKRGKGQQGFHKQSAPGIGLVIDRELNMKALQKHVTRKFPQIFENQVAFRLLRLDAKLAKKRLKIHA